MNNNGITGGRGEGATQRKQPAQISVPFYQNPEIGRGAPRE